MGIKPDTEFSVHKILIGKTKLFSGSPNQVLKDAVHGKHPQIMILNEITSKDEHTHIHTIHKHTHILVKEKLEDLEDSSVCKVLVEFRSLTCT